MIFEYREKIQVNGRPITQKALCELTEQIKEVCDTLVEEGFPHPTPFEMETAMAFSYFAKQNCDIVVLETGMGGRLDATNIIKNTKVAALVSISMDHMQYLGKTLGAIAGEKAGILKEGCHVVTASQLPEAMDVIRKKAEQLHCRVTVADPAKASHVKYDLLKQQFDYGTYKKLEISLAGNYQIANAVLACEVLAALQNQGFAITEKALRKGLAQTCWQGRFTVLGKKPFFIADGAHNEDAARKLAETIDFYFTNKRIIYIMGILKDKEYEKIIDLTCAGRETDGGEVVYRADQIITIATPDNPRAMDSFSLAQEISRVHPRVTAAGSLEEAVEMAYLLAGKEDVIIAFGSLSYLGKMMDLVEKRQEKPGKTKR